MCKIKVNCFMLSATHGKTSLWKPRFYTWRRPYVHRWATDYPRQAGIAGGGVTNYVYDQRLKADPWRQNPAVPPATQALHGVLITNSQDLVRIDQLALATHAAQEKGTIITLLIYLFYHYTSITNVKSSISRHFS